MKRLLNITAGLQTRSSLSHLLSNHSGLTSVVEIYIAAQRKALADALGWKFLIAELYGVG